MAPVGTGGCARSRQDAIHFHRQLQAACDRHDASYYPRFKKWCDDYFYLSHRNEARGIGGIFFDDLDLPDQNSFFDFIRYAAAARRPASTAHLR